MAVFLSKETYLYTRMSRTDWQNHRATNQTRVAKDAGLFQRQFETFARVFTYRDKSPQDDFRTVRTVPERWSGGPATYRLVAYLLLGCLRTMCACFNTSATNHSGTNKGMGRMKPAVLSHSLKNFGSSTKHVAIGPESFGIVVHRFVDTVPDIFGLVWPNFRPKSGSKSKISGRILKFCWGSFS